MGSFLILFFLLVLPSCFQGTVPSSTNEAQSAQTQVQQSNQNQTNSQSAKSLSSKNSNETEEEDLAFPSYGRVEVDSCFNKDCSVLTDTSDPNFVFDLAFVDIYQPIYLDYRQESFPGWNGKLTYYNSGEDFTKRLETSPEGVSASFTVWQPDKTMAEDSQSILQNTYYSYLGYFAKNLDVSSASGIENIWTTSGDEVALIKIRPQAVALSQDLAWSLAPPKEYKMVHYVSGGTYEDLVAKCQKGNFSLRSPGVFLCPRVQTSKYSGVNVDASMGGLSSVMIENLLKNLVIWEPVPEHGYRCLGNIATNDLSQPVSSLYGAGQISSAFESTNFQNYMKTFNGTFDDLSQGWADSPMVCVNEKYLLKGKYGEIITWTTKTLSDGTEKRFLILKVEALGPEDYGYVEEGVAYTNLFVTLEDTEGGLSVEEKISLCNGSTRSDDCPLWVLNKKYVNVKK